MPQEKHPLQAPLLFLLGINYLKLTYIWVARFFTISFGVSTLCNDCKINNCANMGYRRLPLLVIGLSCINIGKHLCIVFFTKPLRLARLIETDLGLSQVIGFAMHNAERSHERLEHKRVFRQHQSAPQGDPQSPCAGSLCTQNTATLESSPDLGPGLASTATPPIDSVTSSRTRKDSTQAEGGPSIASLSSPHVRASVPVDISPTIPSDNNPPIDDCSQCWIIYKYVSVYYPPASSSNTDCLTGGAAMASPTLPPRLRP